MNINYKEVDKICWIDKPSLKTHIVLHNSNARTNYSPYAGKKSTAEDVVTKYNKNKEKFINQFLIDRDGTVTQTYPDDCWCYHLNIPGSRGHYDRSAISIELINEGYLTKDNGRYYIHGMVNHQYEFLGPMFECKFRNYQYWAQTDKRQIDSLIKLTKYLCNKHAITPVFYEDSTKFNTGVWKTSTIFAHSNVNPNVLDMPYDPFMKEALKNKFESMVRIEERV